MDTRQLTVNTSERSVVDITNSVQQFIPDADGLVNVFVQHATAGVAIIETGSGTEEDLSKTIERLLPLEDIYIHRHGHKGHGADHVLPAFISPSVTVPVEKGCMLLGTWQRIVVVDPNSEKSERNVRLSFIS